MKYQLDNRSEFSCLGSIDNQTQSNVKFLLAFCSAFDDYFEGKQVIFKEGKNIKYQFDNSRILGSISNQASIMVERKILGGKHTEKTRWSIHRFGCFPGISTYTWTGFDRARSTEPVAHERAWIGEQVHRAHLSQVKRA